MPVKIRRAELADLDQIVALSRELVAFHVKLDPRLAITPDAGVIAQCISDDNWRVFLAEDDTAIVGFIAGNIREMLPMFPEKYRGMISDAVVTARLRRRGIGEQLYRAMADWFRERGVSAVELSAAVANPISQVFWRKMGFNDYMLRMWGEVK